jgi:molybdopterin molybdotransferase
MNCKSLAKKLKPAQIYESNSYTLQALLHEMKLEKTTISRIQDNPEKLLAGFKKALRQQDVIIITGGVSVGDYEFRRTCFGESSG